MLLRRITEHVKAQNWTAVALDFVIVVVGVFIGIQVANWNDVGRQQLSERQYLDRFADELEYTLSHIQDAHAFSKQSLGVIEEVSKVLYQASATDDEVIEATKGYLTTGAFFAKFKPNRTTFDDLVSTGNFDVIKDDAIRTGLISLYARYEEAHSVIEGNIDWIQQGEDRIYYNFDAFRYDARTKVLFDDVTPQTLADDIRENRALLRRHAAFHYWLKVRSIEFYEELEPEVRAVLGLIQNERGE